MKHPNTASNHEVHIPDTHATSRAAGRCPGLGSMQHLRHDQGWHNRLLLVMTVCAEAQQHDDAADPCNRDEHG